MTYFTIDSTITDSSSTKLQGLSDIQVFEINGQTYLLAAAEADGALTSFRVETDGSLTQVDVINYSSVSGTKSVVNLQLVEVNGALCVIPAGRYEDSSVMYDINTDGSLSNVGALGTAQTGGMIQSFRVDVGGQQYLYTTKSNQSGFTIQKLNTDGSLQTVGVVADTGQVPLGDVSDFASAQVNGQTYLFAVSAFDAGLISYRVNADGTLVETDVVLPGDGAGFSLVQTVETVEIDGTVFVLIGSAGTDSITTYEVNADGSLSETDHLMDTGETRFQDITTMETFEVDGQTYALVAGSDDGVTLVEIAANGEIIVVATLSDDFDTTLENVSDIEVTVSGSEVTAFIASGSENGITTVSIDLSDYEGHVPAEASLFDQVVSGPSDEYLCGNDVKGGMSQQAAPQKDAPSMMQAEVPSDPIYDGSDDVFLF